MHEGCPAPDNLDFIGSRLAYDSVVKLGTDPNVGTEAFHKYFPKGTNPLAIDLIKSMLKFHPTERFTVEQCLQHDYLADFRGQMRFVYGCVDIQTVRHMCYIIYRIALHLNVVSQTVHF